jgi:hypothetical protein
MQYLQDWEAESMEENLINLLQTFGYPVFRQGSLSEGEAYPDTFFTFWNNSETGQSFYDNETAIVDYDFSVNVYSTDPETVYSLIASARTLLKSNNWIIVSRGYDVGSDEITHVGRGFEIEYLNTER